MEIRKTEMGIGSINFGKGEGIGKIKEVQLVKMPAGDSIQLTFLATEPCEQVVEEVRGLPVVRFHYKTEQGLFSMGKLGKKAFDEYVALNQPKVPFTATMTRHEPVASVTISEPSKFSYTPLNFTFSS